MKRKQNHAQVVGLIGAILLFAPVVGQTQPRDNPLERARHHMELGQEAFNQGRHVEAALEFVNAYAASPFAAFLYNAGLAYEKAGDTDKTIDFFRRYLAADPNAQDYAQVDMKIRALLAGVETGEKPDVEITKVEMKSLISVRTNPPDATVRVLDDKGDEVTRTDGTVAQTVVRGKYTIEASHADYRTVQTDINVIPGQVYMVVVEMSQGAFLGFLHIKTDVPGAAVFLDNKGQGQVGTTPWGNVLSTGKHTFWVEKPGYKIIKQEFDIALAEQKRIDLELERMSFGSLLVKSNVEGAKVFVDGQFLGPAPLEEQVSPGSHKVKIEAEGLKDYETDVVVSRGQQTKTLVRLNNKPSRTSAWVSLGFSAALFIGGGVAGFMALDLNNELDAARNSGRLTNDDPRILKGFLWALSADIAFGVGAVVGGLCIYYFLRDPLPPSEGKLFDPVDFEENPENAEIVSAAQKPVIVDVHSTEQKPDSTGIKPEEQKETPVEEKPEDKMEQNPKGSEARLQPRVLFTPILGTETAGLGLTVVF